MPVTLEARLRNFSDAPLEGMVLELWVDGRKRRQVMVSIPAESEGVERIALSFDSPGYHFGWVKISGDRLPADNVRYFAVHVGGGIKTLCVGRENTYLTYALNPSLGLIPSGGQAFTPVSLTPERFESALDQIDLGGYELVVLNGLFGMSEVATAKLVDYVENGGRLLVMLDGGEAPSGLRELLPALPIGDRRHSPPLKLGKFDPTHPALGPFKEEMLRGQGGPNFFATRSLKLSEGARAAMSFEDGSPAMVEREVGMGRVILFNGSAYDLNRTDLPLKPLFLPLIHQLSLYLCRPSGSLELEVGEAGELSLSGSAARISSFSDPDGFAPITLPVEGGKVVIDGMELPGVYKAEPAGGGGAIFFAVNVPADESDLAEVDPDRIIRLIDGRAFVVGSAGDLKRELSGLRGGRELWAWFLTGALCLMAIETALSNLGAGRND